MCVVSASDCFGFCLLGIFFGFGWTGGCPPQTASRGAGHYMILQKKVSLCLNSSLSISYVFPFHLRSVQ